MIHKLQAINTTPSNYFDVEFVNFNENRFKESPPPPSSCISSVTFDGFNLAGGETLRLANQHVHFWNGNGPHVVTFQVLENVDIHYKSQLLMFLSAWIRLHETGQPAQYKKHIRIIKQHDRQKDPNFYINKMVGWASEELSSPIKKGLGKGGGLLKSKMPKDFKNPIVSIGAGAAVHNAEKKINQKAEKYMRKAQDNAMNWLENETGKIGKKIFKKAKIKFTTKLFTYDAVDCSLATIPAITYNRQNDTPLSISFSIRVDRPTLRDDNGTVIRGFND